MKKKQSKKVTLIFGGAFDPPHLGHEQALHDLLARPDVHSVWVTPTGMPRLKSCETPAEQRLAMAQLAFGKIPRVQVSSLEMDRIRTNPNQPTTTFDTIQALQLAHPTTEWIVVIGSDQLKQLQQWHRIDELRKKTQFWVLERKGFESELHLDLPRISTRAPKISSSQLRQKLAASNPSDTADSLFLNSEVLNYIRKNKLYKPSMQENKQMKPDRSREIALAAARSALDKKAENVRVLHVSDHCDFTDYFVICSAMSDRQAQAIADNIEDHLRTQNKTRALSMEGKTEARWILIDYGDVVVHIFLDSLRDYYDLERFWATAPRVQIPSEFYGSGASHAS